MNTGLWAWLLVIPATIVAATIALIVWVLYGIHFIMSGALEPDDEGDDDE